MVNKKVHADSYGIDLPPSLVDVADAIAKKKLPSERTITLSETVRYLSGAMSETEADDYREVASNNLQCREQLVQVHAELSRIKSISLAEVVQLAQDKDFSGRVAIAWLELWRESLLNQIKLKFTETRLTLAALAEIMKTRADHFPAVRMILSGASNNRPVSFALYRSGPNQPDLAIEAELKDNGELVVRVKAHPDEMSRWEGKRVEVCLKVQVPVVVGSGEMKDGRLELRVPEAGVLLGRDAGPISPQDLAVLTSDSQELPHTLDIPPLDEESDSQVRLKLLELPVLDEGRFVARVLVPEEFRVDHAGQSVAIYAALTPGTWQLLANFELKTNQAEYLIEALIPNAPGLSGRVAVGLRWGSNSVS